jgi:carbon-monoxide dehydrogenase medium subunit
MKPSPFGYHRASSVADAVQLLSAYKGTARVLAGGQSLGPMLNMRLVRPDALVDINGIDGIDGIGADGDITTVGALVRYSAIERSPEIGRRLGLLQTVVTHIGDRQVRNRGTIGGSLVQGDPTGEMALACLILNAVVSVTGPAGQREIPVEGLYETSYATVLDPCEVLTGVIFPKSPRHHAFAEMCRRHNDFAVISVACAGNVEDDGSWSEIRIGLGGVGETPLRARAAEARLSGSELDDDAIAAAATLALEVIDPPSDIRASSEYRRHLVPIYVRRVLTDLRRSAQASHREVIA